MLGVLLGVATSASAQSLRVGFFDGSYLSADASTRAAALGRTAAVGGTMVRLGATWSGIAPKRPANEADPNDPAYQWAGLDAAVRDAVSAGMTPLVTINAAPQWAEGEGRPESAGFGTWRPDAAAFGRFARAIGARYSGQVPGIPRVRYWQIWNEPNLATYLTPQWVRTGGRWVAASPGIFRALLNAGYAGLKAARSDNFVVTAGTAPYGDLVPGGRRIAPVAFLRGVLAKKTSLDAISHHPYGVGSPSRHALNEEDVAVPDIGKLTRVLRGAERAGRVKPGRKVWVTEMSWDSRPPDPDGVAERTQADWLQEGLYVLWAQGVSVITWFQVTDQPGPNYPATNQSGVFFVDGRPKLSATAFRFPFITRRRTSNSASIWGRAPAKGTVVVEVQRGAAWKRLWSTRISAGAVFTGHTAVTRGSRLRARIGTVTSLVWRVR